MGLLSGYNWVYTTHVFLVAPLLILIPLIAFIFKERLNLSDNLIMMLMYILIAFGIAVLFYHGNKLRTNY